MSRVVLHKQIYKRGVFGGTVNTTLCGRLHQGEDMNVSIRDDEVTCKFCLRRLPVQRLHEAIEFVEATAPLPRCKHGSCLMDHAGELLEPDCGCRYVPQEQP